MLTVSTAAGQGTARPGAPAERHLPDDQAAREWSIDQRQRAAEQAEAPEVPADSVADAVQTKRIKVCRVQEVCLMRYRDGLTPRTRVRNLVAPLRYEDETSPLSENFLRQVWQAVQNARDKRGVTVRFIGYTDDAPLTGRQEQTYGDHLALSKAQAQRVALAVQESLGLPASAIDTDGRGASNPVASNATPQGRGLNRRIEVELWYDDPLQTLPEEPQLCPEDLEEVVTRVYDPPWGSIPALELVNGQPILPSGYAAALQRALSDVKDRKNVRLRFIGYTKNERLDRRTASVYTDDIGLSAERARRAKDLVLRDPLLAGARAEHEGRGFVQSDDVVNEGFIQGGDSFVRVQVVYDEPLALDVLEGIDVTRLTQEIRPKSPFELNVMHITVDGRPIDDPDRSSSDVQRCTDVALDSASIRFRFDNLESRRRLAVAAHPVAVAVQDLDGLASPVRFQAYTNYSSFIDRTEIRIFDQHQSLQAAPLHIIPVDDAGRAEWLPAAAAGAGSTRELKYVLRAYDAKGNYDETDARPLWLYRGELPGQAPASAAAVRESTGAGGQPPELLAAYGESDLALQRIPIGSGTVKVQGSDIPAGYTVWVAGRQVPVDPNGNFAAEEILPTGTHTVEVAVLDEEGNGSLFLRDLQFPRTDLFYFGVADVTVAQNRASGPIDLLQGTNVQMPYDSSLAGRLAFFVNGEIGDRWRLTASADTREGPVRDLFTNFLDKRPDALLRRVDPDYYYPTLGDDSVVEEVAPTLGKFYVKAGRGENYGMWGAFKVGYLDNELAHVDRGLYGASGHFGSEATTRFGEKRMALDGFAAEPGTMSSYEEFRGTGGSVYFLRHQDILRGSERVRIELRDKDSGLVSEVIDLQYGVDYDIDYLQGRILLSDPLTSTIDDRLLVRSGGLSGHEANLVARYEYTPGFERLDAVSRGGQGHVWVNDHLRLGLTANINEEGSADSSLGAANVTVRMNEDSWVKVQTGRSSGLLSTSLRSGDGGFTFNGLDDLSFTQTNAWAYRADVSVGLGNVFRTGDTLGGAGSRVTFYVQNLEAGYSAPGQTTMKDTRHVGGMLMLPVDQRLNLMLKGDQRKEDQGLEVRAVELDAVYRLTDRWSLSSGIRNELRRDRSPLVPLTQEQGERTHGVAQLTYDPGGAWRAYGFVNGRVGAGGSYRPTARFKIDAEVSDGELGWGGRLGTTFLYSERSSLYLNYTMEDERTDNGRRVRRGNLVSGGKTRLSDSSSIYVEERYQNRGTMAGLTHATGVDLVARERWNVGASGEFGTLRDRSTGAETDRRAAGIRLGYGADALQWSSAVEYRRDVAAQLDATHTTRSAWLFRNNFRFSLTPDWRVLGKLNHSFSNSSLGSLFDGGYTEAVVGYAYRPVRHDRLSGLAKYTYFYNVPTVGQITFQTVIPEYVQKSHIAALDLTYDLTADWSIGGKYAYRLGQVSLAREQPQFFDSTAQLVVLRADWRFRKGWESLIEGRMLDLPDVSQRRAGALAAIYRSIGRNVKVGVGYNFTDFSDDLTDMSYDHRGVFLNIIGTM